VRPPSLIRRFERNKRSRNSFGVPEVMQIAELASTRDYAEILSVDPDRAMAMSDCVINLVPDKARPR